MIQKDKFRNRDKTGRNQYKLGIIPKPRALVSFVFMDRIKIAKEHLEDLGLSRIKEQISQKELETIRGYRNTLNRVNDTIQSLIYIRDMLNEALKSVEHRK